MTLPVRLVQAPDCQKNWENVEPRVTTLETNTLSYAPTTLVTALPTSPVDGQIIYYDTGTDGVVWQFRYDAASASSYKWQFIGGPPLTAYTAALDTRTANTYGDLAGGAGPSLTTPVAGEYLVEVAARLQHNTANQVSRMSFTIGAAAASDANSILVRLAADELTFNTDEQTQTLAASDVLAAKYKNDTGVGTMSASRRRLRITPVRVG
jgi:hypothetical protein